MTKDQVMMLVQAHYANNNERFDLSVRQIAAGFKDDATRYRFERQIREMAPVALIALAPETKNILEPLAAISRAALVLKPALSQQLDEFVREHRGRAALLGRSIGPRTRLLFTGPPGCGKTSCASALASELNVGSFRISFPRLTDSHLGETAKNVRTALRALKANVLVVLDEIDAIGTARTIGNSGADRDWNVTVSALLTELDDNVGDGVFIATTNRPELLDPALRRRFDDEFEFAAPDDAAKNLLAVQLWTRFGLEPLTCPRSNGEVSFDAVAKTVTKVARKRILDDADMAKGAA